MTTDQQPAAPPETVILSVGRAMQVSLIEFSLEVLWNGEQLGKLWTGLSANYRVSPGSGTLQIALYRRYWRRRVATAPLTLTLAENDQTAVTFTAASHTLTVLRSHIHAARNGFAYDATFGMPTITFTVNDGPPETRSWIILA
ncbi:MAG: hypothetical protein RLZ98_1094 [Pseudomonadota bacterium]|jgi:hypothetical protein